MSLYNKISIRHFLESEFSRFQGKENGVLLDLGCGERPYRHLYEHHFTRSIAADYDVRTVLDVRLDAACLPFKDASVDVLLLSEVIEHLPDINRALKEINRVLKPTGLLLISWPFNYMLHETPNDYARLTEFGMAKLLSENGMHIELMYRRGGAFVLLLVLLEFFVTGALESICRLPLLGKGLEFIKQPFLHLTFGVLYRLLIRLSWHREYERYITIGAGLKGVVGQLNHWPLGYCCRVRKNAECV